MFHQRQQDKEKQDPLEQIDKEKAFSALILVDVTATVFCVALLVN